MNNLRNYNLELLRLFATLGVIFVHVGICWIAHFGNAATKYTNCVYSTVQQCMFGAVPIFMMITGHLLMNKEKMEYKQAFKYFKRIAILLILFGTIFAWMELFFQLQTFNLKLVFGEIKNVDR